MNDRCIRGVRGVAILLISSLVACSSVACRSREQASAPLAPTVLPVTLPELSRVDPSVQEQIRARHAALTERVTAVRSGAGRAPSASGESEKRELGEAFGGYGMVLHAAEYYQAAEPSYLNAQALMPDDPRWPYYLAHLYTSQGETDKAVGALRRVLEIRPNDVPALVWLGRKYLDQGQPDRAEQLFAQAQGLAPSVIAAQVGLGQAALAKKDFQRAVQLLESVLSQNPGLASVYAPLAMAYRGLGQNDKAESVAKQWRNTEVAIPDPLRLELDTSLESALSYETRGVRALGNRDFAGAAALFRHGLTLAKSGSSISRSLRHKLGTALALSGDVPGAMREFEETIREAPRAGPDEPAAKASYSVGVLLATQGRTAEAITRLTAAVRYDPDYLEARIALGDLLRTSGRSEAALPQYADAVRINPRAAEARLSYAMTLVRLRRYADARIWLEESVRAQPDRPELAHALARLLASAPDPAVRDGQRALGMAEQIARTNKSTDVGETVAMALAETGNFRDAIGVQRGVLAALQQRGSPADLKRLSANLRLYESGRPSRTPWPDDDPAFARKPPVR